MSVRYYLFIYLNILWIVKLFSIGSKTTDECGDEWRRVHNVRVGIVQVTGTYECLEVRRRVHATGDEYIRVPRGQKTSTYDRRRVHTSA